MAIIVVVVVVAEEVGIVVVLVAAAKGGGGGRHKLVIDSINGEYSKQYVHTRIYFEVIHSHETPKGVCWELFPGSLHS